MLEGTSALDNRRGDVGQHKTFAITQKGKVDRGVGALRWGGSTSLTFNAISENGRQIKPGGSEKVFWLNRLI